MNKEVREMYLLMLGANRKPIIRIDMMPGNWIGLVHSNHSVSVVPPFVDKSGNTVALGNITSVETHTERLMDILFPSRAKE